MNDLVASGLKLSKIFYLVAGTFIIFLLACFFIPWVQTIQGEGKVIAYSPNERQQSIDAPVEGKISKWHVSEGDYVQKGAPIVEITDIDPSFMERLSSERDAIKSKISAFQKSLEASEKNVERQTLLAKKGLSSQRSLELAEIEYSKFQSELGSATAELTRIETRITRQSNQVITSPREGTIMKIIAPQGNVIVKSSDSLAILIPKSTKRAVELIVSGNDIPLVSKGRKARIQFEGWPAIQFSGWPSKAIGTFGGEVGIIDQGDNGTGNFRIIIFNDGTDAWPDEKYLKQGARAIGWVLLDPVKLGWELWRKFNGFPPSINNTPPESK